MAILAVLRIKSLIQRAFAWITFRDLQTAHWASFALPVKRVFRHRRDLSSAAVQLEKSFLGVSRALEGLAGRGSSLVKTAHTLLTYSLGQDGDTAIFQTAIGMIERPLNFNDACLDVTATVDRNLASVAEAVNRLGQFRSTLDRSIAPLRILKTMFRIESASSPPEVLSLFVSLSAEIDQLMQQMATFIARQFEAIESTAETMNNVAAQVRTLHKRQIQAQRRRAEIQDSLAALQTQIDADKVRDVRLVTATEAMSQEIASLVGGLQYQDILNQRIEHVIEGLDNIAEQSELLDQRTSAASLCFLRDASRVESAQLEGVREVLGATVDGLRMALDGLALNAKKLGTECELHNGSASGQSAPGQPAVEALIKVLLETIRENTELIRSTSGQARDLSVALEPIGGLLGNLTDSILRLSARIRLISLNAQIQAAQAGEGTGLEVLACRARIIAEEIVVQVANLAEVLAGLKQQLSSCLADVAAMHTRSADFLQLLLDEGELHSNRLQSFQARMSADRMAAGEQIERIQAESVGLSASFDACSPVLEVIAAARCELRDFSDALSLRMLHHPAGSGVEELARSYTAATERSAHDRALGAAAGLAMASSSSAVMAEGSIELF